MAVFESDRTAPPSGPALPQLTALEIAADGIVITDRGGCIEWVNPAFLRMTGYARHEIIGRNPSLLKSGEQPDTVYGDLGKTILAGGVWHGELINRRKDGSTYFEEQSITPMRALDGEIAGFIAIKQDVTARRTDDLLPAVVREVPPAARGSAETVLLVEDDDGVRRMAVEALTGFGYRVLEAARPTAALATFERHREAVATCSSPTWSCPR